MIFLIACIVELVICVLSAFIPTVYTRDYSWIKIKGVGSLYNKEGVSQLTLLSYFDYIYIAFIAIVVVTMITYLILYFTKKSNLIPKFVLEFVFAIPILLMIAAEIMSVTRNTTSGGGIYVGTGTQSGLTVYGWIMLVAFVIVLILLNVGLVLQRKKLGKDTKATVKELKTKKPDKDDTINPDDWK